MQMFDNINTFVKDDLKLEIRSGSKVSIAAACFSIYAYQELKEQLSEISDGKNAWERFLPVILRRNKLYK